VRRGFAALVPAIAIVILVATVMPSRGDVIADEARELSRSSSYKRRLAAVLALSKSHEGRAVRALARALTKDRDPQIRRVAALALAKSVDASTPAEARTQAFAALDAAGKDRDTKVRELAGRSLHKLASLRAPPAGTGRVPAVFVLIGESADLSSQASRDTLNRLTRAVRQVVVRRAPDVATEWPGQLPTERQLVSAGTRAFRVAATVSELKVKKLGGRAEIACTVSVRIAPWNGTDGAERWVAHKAASASGSGKATTGGSAHAVTAGIRDCVLAVAEEVTAKQVVPFLRKAVADG